MISVGFMLALIVGVVVALLVLAIGMPVLSNGTHQTGLHDNCWSDDGDLFDATSFLGGDWSDDSSSD